MNDISKPRIDITMTAVLRPIVLSNTLTSLKENLCKEEESRYRLIINVDPVGEDVDPMRVIKTAKKNFSNVIYNIPEKPSFPNAVRWVWSQADASYIFHVEDDWKFNFKIDIDDMIRILNDNKTLSSLRLNKYKTPKGKSISLFSCKWVYQKGGFYIASDWKKQFGLNPILIKKEFIAQALPKMRDDVNPEKQFRYSQKYMRDIIRKWKYGIYGKPGQGPAVTDIGRKWINGTKFHKPREGTFLTWDKD